MLDKGFHYRGATKTFQQQLLKHFEYATAREKPIPSRLARYRMAPNRQSRSRQAPRPNRRRARRNNTANHNAQAPTRRSQRNTRANRHPVLPENILSTFPNERAVRRTVRGRQRRVAELFIYIFSGHVRPVLETLFSHLPRESYAALRQVNRQISRELPAWNAHIEPMSVARPAPVHLLQVECTNGIVAPLRRAQPVAPPPPGTPADSTAIRWVDPPPALIPACRHDQSNAPPRTEFYWCTGRARLSPQEGQLDWSGRGGLGHHPHWVCSRCAWVSYVHYAITLWWHLRIIPFCRNCSIVQRNQWRFSHGRIPTCQCARDLLPTPTHNWLCARARERLMTQQQALVEARLADPRVMQLRPRIPVGVPNVSIHRWVEEGQLTDRNCCQMHCWRNYTQLRDTYGIAPGSVALQPESTTPPLPFGVPFHDDPHIVRKCMLCLRHVRRPWHSPTPGARQCPEPSACI